MRTDNNSPVCPTAVGGENPGRSAWGSTAVGAPNAATAGDHPDPRTIAASCSLTPVRSRDDVRGLPREFVGGGQGFGHSGRA